MIALFKDGQPELIDTLTMVNERIESIKSTEPGADLEKREPVRCGKCGSPCFDHIEAVTCPCDEE